jgi:hypothetical protein
MMPVGSTSSEGARLARRWVPSERDIATNLEVLGGLLEQMTAGGGREYHDLSYAERYTLGLRAAAQWSAGLSPNSPLTGEAVPLDAEHLASELALAELLADGDLPSKAPAAGVRAWLSWLTGRADRLVFLDL